MSGFDGSYLGADDRISPRAVMECKICWTPYDPQEGDDMRQIEPGTPFVALPEDWSCPTCSATKKQFLVADEPASEAARQAVINQSTTRLVTDFREVYHSKMRDVPTVNTALQVEAVGFRIHDGRPTGVLLSPWFMSIVVLPGEGEDWSGLEPGTQDYVHFPSGAYEFLHNARELTGGYKACSLFSTMNDFKTQAQAIAVAEAVIVALFNEESLAEADHAPDIDDTCKAEGDLGQADGRVVDIAPEPTRRSDVSAVMAQPQREEG